MEEYIRSISKEVHAKYRRISSLITHSPSIGRFHEEIIATAIGNFLSKRFSIKTGFVYNVSNRAFSNQIDILIIDENYPSPYLFKEKDFCIAFSQAVVCAIEVKSYFGRKEFNDIIKGAIAFRAACSTSTFMAFAFSSSKSLLSRLAKYYQSIDQTHDLLVNYPVTIAIFDQGTLAAVPEKYATVWGHYFIHHPNQESLESVLAYFLATVLKHAQRKAGIASENPYSTFLTHDLRAEHQCFRFGIGCLDGKLIT